jgi:hypothetical protein
MFSWEFLRALENSGHQDGLSSSLLYARHSAVVVIDQGIT